MKQQRPPTGHGNSRRGWLAAAGVGIAIVATACSSSTKSATIANTSPAGSGATTTSSGAKVRVALILKNTSNPFFVSMQKSAEAEATKVGVTLTVSAGKVDGDEATQITAIEDAISAGAKGILITPNGPGVNPSITKARNAGLYVIALDTPPNPANTVDITFATDNLAAGKLIGQWAAAQMNGKAATIAMLDLFNDKIVSVDVNRDHGFLQGMGINPGDPSKNGGEAAHGNYSGGTYTIACHEATQGAEDGGRTAMENCLSKNSSINLVYMINEPAASGAHKALQAAGKASGTIIVSVDGGCSGVNNVKLGVIGATSQQYPSKMAGLGVDAINALATNGAKPTTSAGLDFYNTGVALVTDKPSSGITSITSADGANSCWGSIS